MAKKPTKSSGGSRKGKVPEGWTQISFQVPSEIAKVFREVGASSGHGGGKLLGTAAIAFINSLDAGDRQLLMRYVKDKTWSDPKGLDPARVKALVQMILGEEDENTAPIVEPVWYVDKIADPELTPEPGKKWSDRQQKSDDRKQGG